MITYVRSSIYLFQDPDEQQRDVPDQFSKPRHIPFNVRFPFTLSLYRTPPLPVLHNQSVCTEI